MESLEGMTCGTSGHGPDCLCDVVVSQETPIVTHAVQGMWMGQEVCDANGYENWDDDQEILNYLCDVLFLHDCYDFRQKYCQENNDGQEEIHSRGNGEHVTRNRSIRVTVREAMSTRRVSIAEVLREQNLTAEEFTQAISNGHWEMNHDTLMRFERTISDPSNTYKSTGEQFGLSGTTVARLYRYWPLAPIPKTASQFGPRARTGRVRELISQGVRNKDIIKIIQDEFGETIDTSSISKMKRRPVK